MSWTGWEPGTEKVFPGFQVNVNVDEEHEWIHYLVAPPDEQEPNENHIHLKCSMRTGGWVVAVVKVDNIRVINRRELIRAINRETGLNLQYR